MFAAKGKMHFCFLFIHFIAHLFGRELVHEIHQGKAVCDGQILAENEKDTFCMVKKVS